MNRALIYSSALCFGGSSILAGFAAAAFLHREAMLDAGWILLTAAVFLATAGLALQGLWRGQHELLLERQSRLELLDAQLAQQANAVDSLADGLDIALFICDSKAAILYANRPALQLFRFSDPVGRTLLAVTLSHELEQLVLKAFQTQVDQHAEMNFAYPADRVGLAKAWPHDGANRVFLSVYDITDLRRLERVRRDFVSNVSHELRTPLTIIRSMSETILDDPDIPAAKRSQYLEKMISEVDRLTLMASDLLVLTAAESQAITKSAVDLAETFRGVTDQLVPKAKGKGLDLRYTGPFSMVVPAHAEQMRQVALNLIDNAINYTSQGRIIVALRQEGSWFVASVNDSGLGIASDDLPRIFERFYRVDKGRSRGTGGTGLGLSIVKHIVEAHGGTVSVDSSLNVGSTFTIRLPMLEIAEGTASDED